jgi:hypothetical protein
VWMKMSKEHGARRPGKCSTDSTRLFNADRHAASREALTIDREARVFRCLHSNSRPIIL